jgi:putative ABC transport system permease protein
MNWYQVVDHVRFGVRRLQSDRLAAGLLTAVVMTASFLGAAAPAWVESQLDNALHHGAESAGRQTELTRSEPYEGGLPAQALSGRFTRLYAANPVVEPHFTDERWAVTTGPADLVEATRDDDPLDLPKLEVELTMSSLIEHATLIDGALPREDVVRQGRDRAVDVVAVPAVAEGLGLRIGDEVVVGISTRASTRDDGEDEGGSIRLRLTGLVEPSNPDEDRWRDVPAVLDMSILAGRASGDPPRHYGTLLAHPQVPSQLVNQIDRAMKVQWWLTLDPSSLRGSELAELQPGLRRLENSSDWRTSLPSLLDEHMAARGSAESLAAYTVVSFAGLLVAVLLLAIAVVVERRADALRLACVRGARRSQLATTLGAEAAFCALLGACIGLGTAVLVVPGEHGWPALLIPTIAALLTVTAFPVLGLHWAGRDRRADRPEHQAIRPPAWRLVLEGGAVLLALVTIGLLAQREAPTVSVDPVVSITPLVVTAAAGLVTFRVLPYMIAAMVSWAGRLRGVTSFVAATRAARGYGHSALALVAVLVAVGIATFGTSVTVTASEAQESVAWKHVGADAVITWPTDEIAPTERADGPQAAAIHGDSQTIRDLVPSAHAVAIGYHLPTTEIYRVSDSRTRSYDVIAMDVPAWENVVRSAPDPVEPLAMLAGANGTSAVPAILIGSSSADVERDGLVLELDSVEMTVEFVGRVHGVAGLPLSPTVLVPADAVPTGVDLGDARIAYLAGEVSLEELESAFVGAEILRRADVLADLRGDALLGATVDVMRIAAIVSAVLAGTATVLGLLVTAKARSYSMSVLRTLGLASRSGSALLALEVVPSVAVAAAVGAAVGLGVVAVSSSSVDYAQLSTTVEAGRAVTLDIPGAATAAGGVLAVVLVLVTITVVASRRARLGAVLRAGESS